MKTIGKIAALAMTLSLAFVLTACGGSGSSSAAASSAASSAGSASASAVSDSASASAASASAASESASASAASASSDADLYNNEFFGLQFSLPQGWTFADASSLSGNGVATAAAGNSKVDMVAINADQNQMVLVLLETSSDSTAGMTAEKYLEAQNEQMTSSFGDNYTYTSESATITFDGIDRELPATVTTVDIQGNKLVVCRAVAEKDGNFFDVVAMGATEEEVTGVFKNFGAIKN